MNQPAIRFENGATYEQYMGVWSQKAGLCFLDWLAPATGAHWIDVGCGNGAFTQLLLERCAPRHVEGVDPSAQQIAFAKERFAQAPVETRFWVGDAMALPQADNSADQAVMALVIFFVPEPARGVAEMARVLRPGGIASAYAWDMDGGGFPWEAMHAGMRRMGLAHGAAPSPQASHLDVMQQLWVEAGMVDVHTSVISVERHFESFDAYWQTGVLGPSIASHIQQLDGSRLEALRLEVHTQLGGVQGPFTVTARAHAAKGRRP